VFGFLADIAATAWFPWVGGAVLGFTAGAWLDAAIRRREPRTLVVPAEKESGGSVGGWAGPLSGVSSIQHTTISDDALTITLTDIVTDPPCRLALILSTVQVDRYSFVKDFHCGLGDYVHTSALGGPDVKDHSIALTPPLSSDPTKPATIQITLSRLTDTKRNATVSFEATGFDYAGKHFMNSGTGALLATRAAVTAVDVLVQWGKITEGRVVVRPLNLDEGS
jgi:hypothetical protein